MTRLQFHLKIRSLRIMDTIVCFGAFIGLISRACDAVELTLVVGVICPFVVVDRFWSDNGSSCYFSVMLDKFLPMPDTEFLPFCSVVMQLACGVICSYHSVDTVGSDVAYSKFISLKQS